MCYSEDMATTTEILNALASGPKPIADFGDSDDAIEELYELEMIDGYWQGDEGFIRMTADGKNRWLKANREATK
jgi:hypothetical protein